MAIIIWNGGFYGRGYSNNIRKRWSRKNNYNSKSWFCPSPKWQKVVLVDTDIGLRNLDVVMGLENRIVYDIVDVVEEKCKLRQALIKDKRFEQLFLLPAAQTRDKSAINEEQMKDLTNKLKEEFDYIFNRLSGRNRARFQKCNCWCRQSSCCNKCRNIFNKRCR